MSKYIYRERVNNDLIIPLPPMVPDVPSKGRPLIIQQHVEITQTRSLAGERPPCCARYLTSKALNHFYTEEQDISENGIKWKIIQHY